MARPGRPGRSAGDLRHRFGTDFDLVDERKAGPAGRFVRCHLVRKQPVPGR